MEKIKEKWDRVVKKEENGRTCFVGMDDVLVTHLPCRISMGYFFFCSLYIEDYWKSKWTQKKRGVQHVFGGVSVHMSVYIRVAWWESPRRRGCLFQWCRPSRVFSESSQRNREAYSIRPTTTEKYERHTANAVESRSSHLASSNPKLAPTERKWESWKKIVTSSLSRCFTRHWDNQRCIIAV